MTKIGNWNPKERLSPTKTKTWKIRKYNKNVLEGPLHRHRLNSVCKTSPWRHYHHATSVHRDEAPGFYLYFSKVRKFFLVLHLSSACYGLGSLFPRTQLGNLHFSAQGLGSVSWKRECVRPLPFEGFTPVAAVEDEELRVTILEKDLQGDVLCRESTVSTNDSSLPCGLLG